MWILLQTIDEIQIGTSQLQLTWEIPLFGNQLVNPTEREIGLTTLLADNFTDIYPISHCFYRNGGCNTAWFNTTATPICLVQIWCRVNQS